MRRAYEQYLELTGAAAGVAIATIAALMCADVLARNVPSLLASIGLPGIRPRALPWVTELAEYSLYAGTFIAAPWVMHRGGHVRVDALTSRLSPDAIRVCEIIANLVGLAIAITLIVYGFLAVREAWVTEMYARKTWDFPEWILLLPIPYAGGMLALEFLLRLSGREPASGSSVSLG